MRYAKLSTEELELIAFFVSGDKRRRALRVLAARLGCRFRVGDDVVLPFDTADGRYKAGLRGVVVYELDSETHFGVRFNSDPGCIVMRVDAPDGSHPRAVDVCLTLGEWWARQAAELELVVCDPDNPDWLLSEDVSVSPLAAPKSKEKIERVADLPGSDGKAISGGEQIREINYGFFEDGEGGGSWWVSDPDDDLMESIWFADGRRAYAYARRLGKPVCVSRRKGARSVSVPLAAPKSKEKIERVADLPGSEPLLSLDLGNAYTKVASDRWLSSDLPMEFRSISGRLSKARRHGDYRSPLLFDFEGESWVFGDDVRRLCDGEPTFYTDMSRYTSGFYRRLAAASFWLALSHLAGQGLVLPRVVSSIPVQEFSDGRADLVRQTLAGEYLISSLDGETLHLDLRPENLTIIPEGVGAYTLALSQAVGAGSREVAVLDVGFYTSDLTIFDRGVYAAGAAASAKIGIGQVAEKVAAFLRRDYRYNGDVWAVDARLDDGCIQIGRECVQFSDVRDAAYSDLVDDLVRFYFSKRGSRVPAVVLLTGGKSGALYPFLSDDLLASSSWRVMGARGNVDGGLLFLQKKAARS